MARAVVDFIRRYADTIKTASSRSFAVLVLITLTGGCNTDPQAPTPIVEVTKVPRKFESWKEQLRLVRHQADKVDRGAIITSIRADLADCERRNDLEYTMRFFLLKPDGRNFSVYIDDEIDEDPAKVVKVDPVSREVGPFLDVKARQRITEALESVRFGPEEACIKVADEPDAPPSDGRALVEQSVHMTLDSRQHERYGLPAIWEVTTRDAGQLDRLDDDRTLTFIVSPVDGSILDLVIDRAQVTPMPTRPMRMLRTQTPTPTPQ